MMKLVLYLSLVTIVTGFHSLLLKGRLAYTIRNSNRIIPPLDFVSLKCKIPRHVCNTSFLSMNRDQNQDEDNKRMTVNPKTIDGRKKRVILGYKISSALYGMFGLLIFGLSRKLFYSTGPLLASGLSFILIGAAEHNVR